LKVVATAQEDCPLPRFFVLSAVALCLSFFSGCEPSAQQSPQLDEAATSTERDGRVQEAEEADVGPATASDAAPADEPSATVAEEDQPITTPDQLLAALKAKNPGFTGPAQMQPISPELLVVAIQDPKLRDISPLARQRIGALDLSGCDVIDLSPLEGMPIMELYLEGNQQLADISPLRGMPLQKLYLSNTRVENLGPLRGAPLKELNAVGTRIKDLSPLESSPIEMLWLSECPVQDLSPLKRVPVVSLTVENTEVTDISPLAGHPLQRLHIGGCAVADLTPVAQMQLTRLIFDPNQAEKGLDAVRSPSTIQELGTNFDNRMPPAQFWELYDEGKLN
jgi:Leucine-rich repeat (LRR) protein